jgi:hypothetical protein
MSKRVIYEDTYFIGEFEVTTDIEDLTKKVKESTKIRAEHQIFSSTNEEQLPLVLKEEGVQVLHLKTSHEYLRNSEGFLHAESTDEAKQNSQISDTDQMLRVYSGATELQGFVKFSERGLSDLFIVDSNTHCILQVLVSQAVFQRPEDAISVVLVFFLGEKTSLIQVKKLVAQQFKVAIPLVDETYFTYKGKLVEDHSTVRDLLGDSCSKGLVTMSRVETATIQFSLPDELKPLPDLKLNLTVRQVKKVIESQLKKKASHLELRYKGKLLKNSPTLIEYNVQNESIIELVIKDTFTLAIINVSSGGKEFSEEVKENTRVSELKAMIRDTHGLTEAFQHLICRNKIMENNLTLSNYDINDDSKLYLVYHESIVLISANETSFPVSFTGSTSVKELKENILEMQVQMKQSHEKVEDKLEEFAVDLQQLVFRGEELTEGTLADYQVRSEATLFLSIRLRRVKVFVEHTWTGQIATLDINLNETVLSLKQMILNKTRFELNIKKLIFQETVLHDERTLTSYGVISRSKIMLLPEESQSD